VRRRSVIGALALLATIAAPKIGAAQDEPAPLDVRLVLAAGKATVSFDVTGAFTESFRRKLGGGLTSRVLIELELLDPDGGSVATTVRACQLRLDVWDDVLFVGVTDEDKTKRKTFQIIDEALKFCGIVENVPIAELPLLTAARGYRLVVRVALNPVSPEVLDRTREFMANPRGTAGGRPRAFFGAVAKLFRSDSTAAGERFLFQSGRLARPTGVPR
jgi:hypothetical protein